MKKLLFILAGLISGSAFGFSPVRQVQISTNSLPQQSGYYNVAGGTVTNLANTNQVSSGTYTINGGTMSWNAGVDQGTRFVTSTQTFRGGYFSGTRNDNSTTTLVGAGINGTITDSSTRTYQGSGAAGTITDTSTRTYQGAGIQGTITDFSTHTFQGALFSGVRSDNSTTTYQGAVVNGTITRNSTETFTGSYTIAAATITNFNLNTSSLCDTCVGYFASSMSVSGVWIFPSNVFTNVVSMTLKPGDWTVSGKIQYLFGSTGTASECDIVISTFSGNTTTDHVLGYNYSYHSKSANYGTSDRDDIDIPAWDLNILTPTTVYLKSLIVFASGIHRVNGSILTARKHR